MTGPERVEWGRAPRGRVWHLLSPVGGCDEAGGYPDAPICSLDHQVVEVTQGQPPRGARVCADCLIRIGHMRRAVDLAVGAGGGVAGDDGTAQP